MVKKKIVFKSNKPFYDIIKRRKQCRKYFVRWINDNTDIVANIATCDIKKMTYFHFNYVSHGRRAQGCITKSEIYKRLAIFFLGVGMAGGFEYGAESFYRYIASNEHSNLATAPNVLKREIMRYIQYIRDKQKLVEIKCNS